MDRVRPLVSVAGGQGTRLTGSPPGDQGAKEAGVGNCLELGIDSIERGKS